MILKRKRGGEKRKKRRRRMKKTGCLVFKTNMKLGFKSSTMAKGRTFTLKAEVEWE